MKDPREWSCTDDRPDNDGWGNNPNWKKSNDDGPYYEDEGPEEIIPDEPIIFDDEHDTDV